ncbi:MAG TPA: hypothetical protein VFY50_03180 [Candidatus Nitrosocosmicus sp.]|nr:hypothetical protein [Candidatus Nitrosocosmicus sp.]
MTLRNAFVLEGRGEVHYASYNKFHEVMAEESYQAVVAGLLEHITLLSLGRMRSYSQVSHR